jgi:hypothetical protein
MSPRGELGRIVNNGNRAGAVIGRIRDLIRKAPADKVERWAIDRLIPYAKNAGTHTDAQIAAIAASVKEWGWTTPVLVGEDGGLIAGHARILAARQLGIAEIPVMASRVAPVSEAGNHAMWPSGSDTAHRSSRASMCSASAVPRGAPCGSPRDRKERPNFGLWRRFE